MRKGVLKGELGERKTERDLKKMFLKDWLNWQMKGRDCKSGNGKESLIEGNGKRGNKILVFFKTWKYYWG